MGEVCRRYRQIKYFYYHHSHLYRSKHFITVSVYPTVVSLAVSLLSFYELFLYVIFFLFYETN